MCKIDTDYSEQGAEALRTRLESFLETLGGGKGQAAHARPGPLGQPGQPAPFWMTLNLPPELAGEVGTVAASRTPSGPLTKPKAAGAATRLVASPAMATKKLEPEAAPSPPTTLLSSFHLITAKGDKIPLAEGNEYTLGRTATKSPSEIDLSGYGVDVGQGVSRKHARLVVTRENCVLEDLGSRNGTFVNGRRLKEGERCTLTGGEKILLGQYALQLQKA